MDLEDAHRAHVPAVWRYVRARLPGDADAEDVTSEVFLRAMRSWDRYDPSRATVGAWLTGIARHAVADWWRRRHPEVPGPVVSETASGAGWAGLDGGPDDPESVVLRAEGADELRRRLGMLTPLQREAVALRFGAELSSDEIGEALQVSPTAARMLVYRGVAKLRTVMRDG